MHRLRLILLVICMLLISIGPAAAVVERQVTRGDDDFITIHLLLPGGMIGGIVDDIPPGFDFIGTTHPDAQVDIADGRIYLAVIGEETITYTLRGSGIPEIQGEIIDLTSEEERHPIPAEQSPAPVAALLSGFIIAAVIAGRWRP